MSFYILMASTWLLVFVFQKKKNNGLLSELFWIGWDLRDLHLKTCLIVLYIEVKTSLCVKMPAGPAYTTENLSNFLSVLLGKQKNMTQNSYVELFQVTYLCHKDAILIELRFENFLVEGFCVELIARSSFNWVCQISNYDIEFLIPLV